MAVFFTKTDPFKDRKDTRERNGNILTLFLNPLPFTHVTCPSSCKTLSTLSLHCHYTDTENKHFRVTEGYNVLKKKKKKKKPNFSKSIYEEGIAVTGRDEWRNSFDRNTFLQLLITLSDKKKFQSTF